MKGDASWFENLLLPSDRRGFLEECYFTYSHSPLKDAQGKVVGVQTSVIETTERVLGERRMLILRNISKAMLEATSKGGCIEDTCEAFFEVLCDGNPDVPFAAQYVQENGTGARLIYCKGIDRSLPGTIDPFDRDPWGVSQALRERTPVISHHPKSSSQSLPGAWPEPTNQVVALPLLRGGPASDFLGVMLVGVNSRLRVDESYMNFLNLIAAELAGSITRIQGSKKEIDDVAALRRAEAALRVSEARLAEEASALKRLYDWSSRLWQTRDLHEGLVEMLRASIQMMGADKGNVQILDARGNLTIAAQQGFDQPFLEFFKQVSVTDNFAGARALRSGRRVIIEDVEAGEKFAALRHVALTAGFRAVQATPLMADDGKPLGVLSTHFCNVHRPSEQQTQMLDLYARRAVDFIERHRSEEALRRSEERYKGIYENAGTGIYIADLAGRFQYCNPAYASMHGYTEDELRKLTTKDLVHPEDWPRHTPQIQLLTLEKVRSFEIMNRCIAKAGDILWVHKHVSLLRDAVGRPESMIALVTDVTARKRAEDARELLHAELDHRVKNALATVSAVVGHTQEGSRSVGSFAAALKGRIRSMATTHELLSARRWQGISFTELVRRELAPYASRSNTEIDGPEVILEPEAGLAMAMVLHELATNAAKYGALSTKGGHVMITWERPHNSQPPNLLVNWKEFGGPPVVAPEKSSFGTSTIRDLIPYEFGGRVDLTLAPEGVRCRIELPADWLSSGGTPTSVPIACASS